MSAGCLETVVFAYMTASYVGELCPRILQSCSTGDGMLSGLNEKPPGCRMHEPILVGVYICAAYVAMLPSGRAALLVNKDSLYMPRFSSV